MKNFTSSLVTSKNIKEQKKNESKKKEPKKKELKKKEQKKINIIHEPIIPCSIHNELFNDIVIKINSQIDNDVKETIQKGNKYYEIERSDDEPYELFVARAYYIIDKYETPDNSLSWEKIISNSFVWKNIKFYNMTYPTTVTKYL